jgi:ribosomal protein L29
MNNEQEWRSLLLSEIKEVKHEIAEVKKEVMNLKLKVATAASFIGALCSGLYHKFFN